MLGFVLRNAKRRKRDLELRMQRKLSPENKLMSMLFFVSGTRQKMLKKRLQTKEMAKESPTLMRCLMFRRQH